MTREQAIKWIKDALKTTDFLLIVSSHGSCSSADIAISCASATTLLIPLSVSVYFCITFIASSLVIPVLLICEKAASDLPDSNKFVEHLYILILLIVT